MTKTTATGHSEELFTDDRDYWFNPDFLDLMARRWQLHEYSSLLDIGAGLCHWSKLLVPYLTGNKQITAYDKDPKWSKGNAEIRRFFEAQQATIDFVQGDAHTLPFPDHSFDVVTCQTLLIHVSDPELVLREMKRVVKRTGIVICSEPNNRIQPLIQDSTNKDEDINTLLHRVKQNLFFEKHKAEQNNGNQSFGDLLAGTMNQLGYRNIQTYINDKMVSIYPPYDTREQQLKINTYLKWGKTAAEKAVFDSEYADAARNNAYPDFLQQYSSLAQDNKVVKSLKQQTYANSGASLLYLVSGY